MSGMKHHKIFEHFEPWSGHVDAGLDVNFLGVRIRRSYWSASPEVPARDVVGAFPPLDEEYLEWIDILEAAEAATDHFVMLELGAGYGRWLVNAAVAYRLLHNGDRLLVGVEAEPSHYAWLEQHCDDNGVGETERALVQ